MRETTEIVRERPTNSVRASRTAWWQALFKRPLAKGIAFGAAAALFLSSIGALDSAAIPFVTRTIWYLAYATFAALLISALVRWSALNSWSKGHRWRRVLAIAAILTPVMALTVWLSTGAVSGRFPLAVLPRYMLLSLVTSFVMTTVGFAILRPPALTQASAPDAPPARFLARLPAKFREAALWAVQAEDHYLRLHTAAGQDLILMRLGDAIDELEGIEGARTHRSWWVARAAVKDIDRSEERTSLVLPDGTGVPVSRSYRRTLREAGWF